MAVILVVDDQANRKFLVRLLGYAGHRTLEAGDGDEALQLIRTDSPDLVVTDVLRPRMDGYEFVRRLRADTAIRQPRVAFRTATHMTEQDRELAAASGVFTVIPKVAEPHEILTAITAALVADDAVSEMPAEEFDRTLRLLNQQLLDKV
ncbi:MAG: hypothetical protein QOG41_343, partial [Thermoleophilaceae bacterium]|nr:hypothetical protein [Thermoleophilaceae bacterium]